ACFGHRGYYGVPVAWRKGAQVDVLDRYPLLLRIGYGILADVGHRSPGDNSDVVAFLEYVSLSDLYLVALFLHFFLESAVKPFGLEIKDGVLIDQGRRHQAFGLRRRRRADHFQPWYVYVYRLQALAVVLARPYPAAIREPDDHRTGERTPGPIPEPC